MQVAARARVWSTKDFELIMHETERLPGQAYVSWKKELVVNEAKVRAWAFGLVDPEPNRPVLGQSEARQ